MSMKRQSRPSPSPNGSNGTEVGRPRPRGFSDSILERQSATNAAKQAKAEAAGLVFVPGEEVAKQKADAASGRSPAGRFGPGNPGGPGNPHAKQVASLRTAMLDAVTPAEIKALMKVLMTQAKGGDVRAIREIFDRTLGKAEGLDLLAKVAELEAAISAESQAGTPRTFHR